MTRRTRIVATLGPAVDPPGTLEKLLENGLDVARINFSHGAAEEHLARIQRFREVSKKMGRATAVLADLPGPKLRVVLQQHLELTVGSAVLVAMKAGCSSADIALTEPEVMARVRVGQRVLFDDGRLQARVANVTSEACQLTIEVGGKLMPNKGINLPDSELNIAAVTRRDRDALAIAAKVGVDWIALSFVRDASAAAELRGVARAFGLEVPIIAKIERPEAVTRAKEIVAAFDGIMVARGDLGVEIALERVPHVQKRLIHLSRTAGKPVITATDMLDSMRSNPRPTRAEASDVANAVYDGTDAVMLSGETAVGQFPVEALCCMDSILREAEGHFEHDGPSHLTITKEGLTDNITEMTVALAAEIGANAIVAPTITSRTARNVARHRPKCRIIAVSTQEEVVRQQALVWGVQAVMPAVPFQRGDDRLAGAVRAAFMGGVLKSGELVVVLAGHPIEGGEGHPTIRVVRVGADGRSCEP
jgi:pyruvate kinase